jgi:glycosyltransferase involved in cell wall biosynthesis
MRISVVMATYNGSRFLLDQLDSMLEGTRPPDELVLVDDASTDDSAAMVEQRLKHDKGTALLVVHNQRNLGASASFAKGVGHTTGEVVLFADHDDRWMPHKIATMEQAFLQRPGLRMAYSDGLITDAALVPDGRTIFDTRNKAQLALGASRAHMEVAMNPDVKGCTMALDGLFARQLFAHTPTGFDRYWGHDHWAALFAYGTGSISAITEPLLWHRFHSGNTSGAVRFSPIVPAHWKRYLKATREQGTDHFVQRYRLALEQIEAHAPDFSPDLRKALELCLAISLRRAALHNMNFPARMKAARKLHQEGIYRSYYNGTFTLLRDLFL